MAKVEVTPEQRAIRVAALSMTALDFYDAVDTESWKDLPEAKQIEFRTRLEAFTSSAAKLRAMFDATLTKGHADGSVSVNVENIRQPWSSDKRPGRKPERKSAADKLLG